MATKRIGPSERAVMAALERDEDCGWCRACGRKAHNVEQDARRYTCESCGKPSVFGALCWIGLA